MVVIPARNEEALIPRTIEALARQTVPASSFQTILVLNGCTDRTESVAVDAATQLGLPLTVLRSSTTGAGPARRTGMDAAPSDCSSSGGSTG